MPLQYGGDVFACPFACVGATRKQARSNCVLRSVPCLRGCDTLFSHSCSFTLVLTDQSQSEVSGYVQMVMTPCGALPAASPVASYHEAPIRDSAKVVGITSHLDIDEANLTAEMRGETIMVFVLDSNKQPLDPCHPARARQLLRDGKAAVFRRYPFTIILKDRTVEGSTVHGHAVKIDPGSKATGLAVVQMGTSKVVWAAELTHRGQRIRDALLSRRQLRRSRRNRKTRYRKARFLNRRKPKGWLPPSLESRIANVMTWVQRIAKLCPVEAVSMELVKFDTQQMENPEISGVEYQQGELAGYEVREYLLEKWGRKCAYCGGENVPLEIEHIIPRSRGGTDRVSNLTLACHDCNQEKGNLTADEYGKKKHKDFSRISKQAKAPLKDASAVNATRWALFNHLKALGYPVETGSGGRTKWNRTRLGLPKAHWMDAACVGNVNELHVAEGIKPLLIKAMGHGNRQMCRTDKYGFPKMHRQRQKRYFGFQTGDMAKAVVTTGKRVGVYVGRVAVRATGSFVIQTDNGKVDGIHYRFFSLLHQTDGYQYA